MARILSVVAIIVLALGLLLHIVGLATPQWSYLSRGSQRTSYGLWRFCANAECQHYGTEFKAGELKACRIFALIGVGFAKTGLTFAIIHLLLAIVEKREFKLLSLGVTISSLLALGAIITCAVIWGSSIHSGIVFFDLGYSFALSIVGGILITIGGILVFVAGHLSIREDEMSIVSSTSGQYET